MLARTATAFSAPIAAEGWTGAATGTIARDAITLDLQAGGLIDGEYTCDTGPLHFTLDRTH